MDSVTKNELKCDSRTILPVVLAGGQGTRMKSALPKVLHPVMGKPMIDYVLDAVAEVTDVRPIVVVGHGGERVKAAVAGRADIAVQEQQLGTANAVQAAEKGAIGKSDYVIVAYSDMPCLTGATIQKVCDAQLFHRGAFSMLTIMQEDSHGFGRILRNDDGTVRAIVEEAQATPEILAIRECNVGLYCFRAEWLWQALRRVELSPKGEYYLTDLVALANEDRLGVHAVLLTDQAEALGVNNRVHLAEAEAVMHHRVNEKWMMAGVTMISPESTYIGLDVKIEPDVTFYPNCWVDGKTYIGRNCAIGPNVTLTDCVIEEGVTVRNIVAEQQKIQR